MKKRFLTLAITITLVLTLVPMGSAFGEIRTSGSALPTVITGSIYTLVVKDDGSLWGWGGSNWSGQIGNGEKYGGGELWTSREFTPQKIMDGVSSIIRGGGEKLGAFTMALKTDNSLWAWGDNSRGQLGDGTTTTRLTPVKIMDDVSYVATGDSISPRTVAIKTDGSLWAWGSGFLGNGQVEGSYTPIKIMEDVVSVSVGAGYYTMAIKKDGTLWAWGAAQNGRLGDGMGRDKRFTKKQLYGTSDGDRLLPVKVLDNVRSVTLGEYSAMAIKTDNSLWAWGDNSRGQLGDGTTETRSYPIKVLENVSSVCISHGSNYTTHVMAIKTDNSLWGWGFSYYDYWHGDTAAKRLTPFKIMDGVKSVVTKRIAYDSKDATMAIKTDGSLWVWGNNESGELGDGSTIRRWTPTKVAEDIAYVCPGEFHTMAIKSDGTLLGWGALDYNPSIELGKIQGDSSLAPVGLGGNGFTTEEFERYSLRRVDPGYTNGFLIEKGFHEEEIVALTNELIEGVSGEYERAKIIFEWVKENIRYGGGDSAWATLQRREGDCDGFSNLIAAMLQEAGIPVRILLGSAGNGGRPGLHTWNEAFVDGKWIIIDGAWRLFDVPMEIIMIDHYSPSWSMAIPKASVFPVKIMDNVKLPTSSSASTPTAPPTPTTPTVPTVSPTASTVSVNGAAQSFEAYNIEGNNFFKLRDLAMVLNGTEKQFEVGFDAASKAITLTSGAPYTAAGGEMTPGDGKAKTANPTQSTVTLDGKELALTAYNIGGNNFFKLRDLMQALDVYVGYDAATKAVTIDSTAGYVAE